MAHTAVLLEPSEFLDHFLKGPTQSSGSPKPLDFNPFEALRNAADMKESQISELFFQAVNAHNLAPGLKMSLSETCPDKGDAENQKIDAAFFRPDAVPTDGRPHWADQIVPVEFKAHDTAKDPYDDRESGTVDANAQSRKQVRGQIIHYAEKVFAYQHRTSLIFLIVIGRRFRLSRWDRSGTLVTRAVDYVEHPHVLCEMLWYLGKLSSEALGFDPTATRIARGSDDFRRMIMASLPVLTDIDHRERPLTSPLPDDAEYCYVRRMFGQSLDSKFPYYRLEVPDASTGRMRCYLVGKPAFQAPGMAGRGTRGYVAIDVETGRFVWLKDAWRAHYEFVEQEGSVLEQLKAANVVNVPTLICHGDILEQVTLTPAWWEKKNSRTSSKDSVNTKLSTSPVQPIASSSRTLVNPHPSSSKGTKRSLFEMEDSKSSREDCPLRQHRHYRLVVQEVGMRLVDMQYGRQLLQVIADCVYAHKQAVVKANVMHRDISGGNILILPRARVNPKTGQRFMKWTGLLVDWELSKPTGKPALPHPRQPERTGTWQFMSSAVLSDHKKDIEISDELESFFHVTLYYAVRYLKSNCTDVGGFIEGYFDTYTVEKDTYKCGEKKARAMGDGVLKASPSGRSSGGATLEFSSRLDRFFKEALQWFKGRYAVKAYEDSQSAPDTSTEEPSIDDAQKSGLLLVDEAFGPEAYGLEAVESNPFISEEEETVRKPTTQEIQDAKQLTTHDPMLQLLSQTMQGTSWPRDRVKGDNVPIDYKPLNPVGPPLGAATITVKRRKIEAETCGPEFPYAARNIASAPLKPPLPGSMQ
ncbi:hypothetical protein FKP32DRAFT_1594454 [Trametes sanguinea]|nr:hypothetical protein FKP32DRAFT_1594454 [Trametes sanguinea]